LKRLGGDDYVHMDDDGNVVVETTLKNMLKAAQREPVAGGSIIERIRKNKRLALLKIDERVKKQEVLNAADADEGELPEPIDEYEDILIPIFVEAMNAQTIREKQHQTITDLRATIAQLEDRCDTLTRSVEESQEDYQLRLQAMVQASKVATKDDAGDVITHVAEESIIPSPLATTYNLPYGGF
jgi:hypothetical protein